MLDAAVKMSAESLRVERLRDAVERRLGELAPGGGASANRLTAAMREALLSPGKRLRPLLTLLTAWRLGAEELAALDPACAIEMVHAASLVLDDLPCMDDARTRRGRPAVHVVYGEEVAILAAVGLLNQAYALLASTPGLGAGARVDMVQTLAKAVGLDGLVAGQERDLRRETAPSLDGLSAINHHKTGVLFEAAVKLGALVADAPETETAALRRFAVELGLAFQAADDVTDADEVMQQIGRTSLLSVLGADGARREAADRLSAAKTALTRGGAALSMLSPYVDLLVPMA